MIDCNEQIKKDAERYRWLRKQHWSDAKIAVVVEPKLNVKLGVVCPSLAFLDEYIDKEIKNSDA